jgi:hypothetical protein
VVVVAVVVVMGGVPEAPERSAAAAAAVSAAAVLCCTHCVPPNSPAPAPDACLSSAHGPAVQGRQLRAAVSAPTVLADVPLRDARWVRAGSASRASTWVVHTSWHWAAARL